MAGSSSDLNSVSQIWLTTQKILSLNLPSMPGTERGIRKHMENKVAGNPSARRYKTIGKGFEYRADMLPIHAQKALLRTLQDSQLECVATPAKTTLDLLSELSTHSYDRLFSSPSEMVDDGLNLLSVLNRFVAATDDFNREDLGNALMHAEGLIRAGNSLSKTEGGAA
ncbi:hypothetical protein OB934_07380 [Aeromonas salmonicida]|uniref:hypothetical protein n=1 Tax=Aeromonas salmonicida TaxID=645 RepID=UPI00259E5D9C|nr:hypothetical protein [Aeromonas salmonicida]MDM5062616.1 hypothetical protein [Aeromonas salmonicida]